MKRLPIGIEDFEKIRQEDYYYVDKTGMIGDIIRNGAEATLFTRPRRFGKSLNMSMLEQFFSLNGKPELFEGLQIMGEPELCQKYMGQYPVISLSLKGINAVSYETAFKIAVRGINESAAMVDYLEQSERLTKNDKESYRELLKRDMDEAEFYVSLRELSRLLAKHFDKKVIILIDEYDVPLAKAYENGYYDQMIFTMRNFLEQALKTNRNLQFAVLTGCMRISRESIFTGLNNFQVLSISDVGFDEYFGFTDNEVRQLLCYYRQEQSYGSIREWYDGYRFGNVDVYCPWDVMNYLRDLQHNPSMKPESYWKNTSDNAIIRSFIDYAGSSITMKLEKLLSGGYIFQKIEENLTYDYLHSSEDNLWSILYLTGYLTRVRETDIQETIPDGTTALMIPNREIKDIFESTIIKWFNESTKRWNRTELFHAVWDGNSDRITDEMNKLLRKTISYHDYREDFYHAFLAGIFTGAGYVVESNKEHGEGRSDVIVYDSENGQLALFEVKYSSTLDQMKQSCKKALAQIDEKMYAKEFEDSYDKILCYGIAFFKKRCLVYLKN